MAFKFDSDPVHVSAFRAIGREARRLDEAVDTNDLTPDEAMAALNDFIAKHPVPAAPAHVKEEQAKVKKEGAK